jgi:hypothetical protein
MLVQTILSFWAGYAACYIANKLIARKGRKPKGENK